MLVIKRRSLWLQVLLMVVTFGLYSVYWFYWTSREMESRLGRDENVFLWTIFFVVPPLMLYSYYKQGEVYELMTSGSLNRWLIFVLWLFFPPAVWLILQLKLNELADQQSNGALLLS
ncbi:MAG: DUF4234 domain-containing protein [Oligoflexia bacterium]|nr:DUF4234 domain-containing protein [Oligoflexia bacterium]